MGRGSFVIGHWAMGANYGYKVPVFRHLSLSPVGSKTAGAIGRATP